MSLGPFIVNVGLPRTGTTSFSKAVELLGFKSLDIWSQAEYDPTVIERFKANDGEIRKFLSQYHALSDTPFYALRDTFEQYYPHVTLVFTTRPKEDWVKSMFKHQRAGGNFLTKLYGAKGIPYKENDQHKLSQIYDQHHASVCYGLPSIDLESQDDQVKWKLLCSAFPQHKELLLRALEIKWPHENRSRY